MSDAPATRLVIDTNVFVAAGFRPDSISARLLAAVREGQFQLVWNQATRSETEATLRKIPPLSWDACADLFLEEHEFRGPTEPARFDHVPDPADREFAALAAASGSSIVTSDSHLLHTRHHGNVPIFTPSEFWNRLQAE